MKRILIVSFLLAVAFGVAEAAEPGTFVAIDTPAGHYTLNPGTDTYFGAEFGGLLPNGDYASCHGPTPGDCTPARDGLNFARAQTAQNRLRVWGKCWWGKQETNVSGVMSRRFSLSESTFGNENEIDALIRFDFTLFGATRARGKKSSLELTAIAAVTDETKNLEIARGIAGGFSLEGDSGAISVSASYAGIGVGGSVPIPLPRKELVDDRIEYIMQVRLKRGHDYRVDVEFAGHCVQTGNAVGAIVALVDMAEFNFLEGESGHPGGLTWVSATLILGDDMIEILGQHDIDVQSRLTELEAGQAEIMRLLTIPFGHRNRPQSP